MKTYGWSYINYLMSDLRNAPVIHTGQWQSMDVSQSKVHGTHELEDVTILIPAIPHDTPALEGMIQPDLPWAEEHFLERVSGTPHNPAPSHVRWPYAVSGNAMHLRVTETEVVDYHAMPRFDHTYPERFWPKYAGLGNAPVPPVFEGHHHRGIRFNYGDLSDVVSLLARDPLTRQAYLPVWFPEDTGASAHKGPYDSDRDGDPAPIRVPCTLGYHFMIRDGKLSCRYYMRSCDAYRHLRNDVYMACRLTQWICNEYNASNDDRMSNIVGSEIYPILPGRLVMYISSMHLFTVDVHRAS
jgi:hypothetical protein